MIFWVDSFTKMYPNVKITFEGNAGRHPVSSLNFGQTQMAPMSREMKESEIEEIEKKHGFKPSKISVSYDSIAVFVHKDNPIKSLSLEELEAIYSKNRLRESPMDIIKWDQVDVKGEWENQKFNLFGRSSQSGTFGFFKLVVLKKGEFKDTVKEQAGSAAMVQAISKDKMAIGYSSIGYIIPEVKTLALSHKKGVVAYEATNENILSLKYPLSRKLYIYFLKPPDKPLNILEKEFFKYILSKEGQSIVIKDGFIPISKSDAENVISFLEN